MRHIPYIETRKVKRDHLGARTVFATISSYKCIKTLCVLRAKRVDRNGEANKNMDVSAPEYLSTNAQHHQGSHLIFGQLIQIALYIFLNIAIIHHTIGW